MHWPSLPAEAWWGVVAIAAVMVLLALKLLAGRLEQAIRIHKLHAEARRLRDEYTRRLQADDPQGAIASEPSGKSR